MTKVYCAKCKTKTDTVNEKLVHKQMKARNGQTVTKNIIEGKCKVCGTMKHAFTK